MTTARRPSLMMPPLVVTDMPTPDQLQKWWDAMQSDNLSVAYADAFPDTLTDFCLDRQAGMKKLLLCMAADEIAGALWLHDMAYGSQGTIVAGWVGGYFVPVYRGLPAVRLWKLARQWWEAERIRHLFAATHVANRRSQVFIARGMGFHRVGIYPCFTTFHGQATDVVIYSANQDDASLAWTHAQRRALRPVSSAIREGGDAVP